MPPVRVTVDSEEVATQALNDAHRQLCVAVLNWALHCVHSQWRIGYEWEEFHQAMNERIEGACRIRGIREIRVRPPPSRGKDGWKSTGYLELGRQSTKRYRRCAYLSTGARLSVASRNKGGAAVESVTVGPYQVIDRGSGCVGDRGIS